MAKVLIRALPVGELQANSYILNAEGSERALLVDPGDDPERIKRALSSLNLSCECILLTHGHFDHVGAVKDLAADTDCKVFVHELEHTMPHTITAGKLYATDGYADQISVAGMDISVLHTPGHTPGSVCLIIEDAMFSGDTLFAGSCGRTDLPGGDWATIQNSLRSLKELCADYRVFPGHGESTTLIQEKQLNPYMR